MRETILDFTLPEDGLTPNHYGLESLWAAIEEVFPHGLRSMFEAQPELKAELGDIYYSTAWRHIITYSVAAGGCVNAHRSVATFRRVASTLLGTHPRGELRMGLADTYRLLGKLDSSKEQLEAITKELPDTEYATRAKEWLAAEPTKKLAHNCLGCHTN